MTVLTHEETHALSLSSEETHWRVDETVTHRMALPLPFNAGDKPPQVGLDLPVMQKTFMEKTND